MIIITTIVHPILIETLRKKGCDFLYEPTFGYDDLYDKIPQATGIIVATQINIDRAMIDRATSLKWIGRLGSGMEHIDVAYAQQKGIRSESSPEGNRNAVAEHALGLLLGLLRNIIKSNNEVCQKKWLREENRGVELSGKTIGIIGYGHTGSSFAKLLSSFDVRLLVYDKYKTDINDEWVVSVSLEQIQQESDVISLHLPLTDETTHLVNDDFLNALSRCPYIINTSRGSVINTTDLINALKNKCIKGVALDVLENEKPASYNDSENAAFEFLCDQDNVIITPHIAGYSYEASYKLSAVLLEKLGIS